MARLYLFAEGPTEQTFADTVVNPHLAQHGVFMHHPVLIAHAKKKGKVHRGGGRRYVPMKNDIRRLLGPERAADVFFTSMIDLYGISPEFPGLDESENLRHLPEKRVEFLEQQFAEDIGDQRFIPYIQLHEYEAYLFADPTCFRYFYGHHASEIAALKAIADGHATPELINDGQHSAPSKRIIAQLPDYEDAKSVVGPQVAERIGLDVIQSKCPHFSAWLSRLERLGVGTR
jgi:hypothetical protein